MIRLEPTPLTREIFILGGQSNMSGRGQPGALPGFAYQHKVKCYTNAGRWSDAVEPTDSTAGQIDEVSLDVTADPRVSCGVAFGNDLYELRPGREIGIVPVAKGASSSADWVRNASRSTLYGSMLARANEARLAGPIKGLLWWQGEADASNQVRAENWAATFLTMYDHLCTDLGTSDLKCIVTELHNYSRTYWATVQAQQRSLNGARGGNIRVVSAADIVGTEDGGIHVGTEGLMIMAERYAHAMAGMLG